MLNDDKIGFFRGINNFGFGEGMSKREPFFFSLSFDLLKEMGDKGFYPMFHHFIFVTTEVTRDGQVGVVLVQEGRGKV